jgi:hypothetical protein
MLQLLRAVYPQGCLITKIVSVESGNYLVRVSVQAEGVTIVTGFAVSSDLEIAQDKALDRVLKILGIKIEPELTRSFTFESKENNHKLTPENQIAAQVTILDDSSPSDLKKEVSNFSLQRESAKNSEDTFGEVTLPKESVPSKLQTPSFQGEANPKSMDSKVSPIPEVNSTRTDEPSEKTIEELSLLKAAIAEPIMTELGSLEAPKPPIEPLESSLPTPPIDKQYLNNQALIEIKRLGWTNKQGSDYLSTKYGKDKKTRRDLSDEELLDFCTYLQSLP